MKRCISVILLMLVIYTTQAQTWGWNRHIISPYAFFADDIDISRDKYIYLSGSMVWNIKIGFYPDYIADQCYPKHDMDGYIVKMDTLGNVIWKNKFGGVYTNIIGMDTDSDNNVLACGEITIPTTQKDSDTIRYTSEIYSIKKKLSASVLVKYDKAGNYVWSKLLEADNYYSARPRALQCDNNNNVYVSGCFGKAMYLDDTTVFDTYNDYSENITYSNGFIIKYDKSGKRKFFKLLQNGAKSSVLANRIHTDTDGNWYWMGAVSGAVKFDDDHEYQVDVRSNFIVKFNPDGKVIWVYTIPGDHNTTFTQALITDDQNNVYVGGSFYGTLNIGGLTRTSKPGLLDTDCLMLKLSENGKFVWFKQFGSAKEPAKGKSADPETVSDFYINSKGFIYVTGGLGRGAKMDDVDVLIKETDQTNIFLAKLDSAGTTQWVKNYGVYYNDQFGFIDGWGDKVVSAARINMDGGIVEYEDGIIMIDIDDANYYSGYYRLLNDCNATLKFSNGTLTASAGESYKWFFNGTEISNATEQTFVPDAVGDYKVEVTFSETCKSMSSPVTVSVTSVKGQSKYSAISLYPNPANTELNVEGYSGFASDASQYRIYNSSGMLMKESMLETTGGNYSGKIYVSDLQAGLYMLEVITEAGSINKKFVKN